MDSNQIRKYSVYFTLVTSTNYYPIFATRRVALICFFSYPYGIGPIFFVFLLVCWFVGLLLCCFVGLLSQMKKLGFA